MAGDIEVKRYYWSEASTSATTSSTGRRLVLRPYIVWTEQNSHE